MVYLLLFTAQFANVFLLGLNSQFVRDRNMRLCFALSWMISTSQFIYIYVIANTENPMIAFFVSGSGGALGIVVSIKFYTWLDNRKLKDSKK